MTALLCVLLLSAPFYEAHFSSAPMRSVSVFTNPAGLGFHPGSELQFQYLYDSDGPDMLMPGIAIRNFGFGWRKIDSLNFYEVGIGYKLPGTVSIGYAYQFGDNKDHIVGVIAQPTKQFSIGYRTTVGEEFHMLGGLSLYPFDDYITVSGDIEYQDSILNYYYGAMVQPIDGVKLHFHADKEFEWSAGLELSFGQIKIAGAYHSETELIAGGVILSARPYKTFLPKSPEPEGYY
jgi:hypothetical protein